MELQKDHLSDLNRHVQTLETKVATLHASLSHWQKWYLDYAALREEVESLPKDQEKQREHLACICRDFDGIVLTRGEVGELIGQHNLREPASIVNVLSRRIDYVDQNVKTLNKLIEAEENKLAAASVVANPGGSDEETGLPITDIVEELDDEGNVVDFRLQRGRDAESQILETMKKAGVVDLTDEDSASPIQTAALSGSTGHNDKEAEASETPATLEASPSSKTRKPASKRISFAQDTKPGHTVEPRQMSEAAKRLEHVMRSAKEQEASDLRNAVMPENESEEDRETRRQMLDYGMSEIAPVVAELSIDDDDDDDDDESYDASGDEEEDEDCEGNAFQASKRSVITDDYVQRMKELEAKLGFKSAFTADPPGPTTKVSEEGVGKISVVRGSEGNMSCRTSEAKGDKPRAKKGVRFAPQLDIAEENATPAPAAATMRLEDRIDPVGDIVERKTGVDTVAQAAGTNKRASRFKKEQQSAPGGLPKGPHQVPAKYLEGSDLDMPAVPSGPAGQTVASTVVERQVLSAPKEVDDMDDVLLYQAAAAEYNRLRNREVQRQGGFMKPDESPIRPPDEEDGGPKRVSRFKAARLVQH